jgi:hypothetical protein
MTKLLASMGPARTIIVERGGTAWWIPVAAALFVALVAAVVSYCASWLFKRADVNRESTSRVADLVYEAEQLVARPEQYAAAPEGGARKTLHLLQSARVRAQPLAEIDPDLDDRLRAAASFNFELVLWDEETGRARHWLTEAIANARMALVPHLAAPKLIPRARTTKRAFPTTDELNAMPNNDPRGTDLIDALVDWRANQAARESGRPPVSRG